MPTESNRPDVAVFIDFENVYVSVRDKLDANPNFESIMDRCEDFGRVVIARAYADWYRYPRVTSALYANSIEPIYVPTYYYDRDLGRTGRAIKNSVDMNLCIDAMKTLFTNTNIAKFVLATGDRDFIPLVNSIRQQGKEVIIIGIGGAASSHLAQSADEFIFYETLVGKKPVGELSKDLPRAKMPEKGRDYETQEQEEVEVTAPVEAAKDTTASTDIYDVLVHAINLARERGYVCSFGSLKLLMKELMGGEFKENRYKDGSGRPFAKFKDFVLEAERRGKVQVFTSGTVNEVFLPGEDPYTLSQFAHDLKEEPIVPEVEPIVELRMEPRPTSSSGRRRRRRARGSQHHILPITDVLPEDFIEEPDEDLLEGDLITIEDGAGALAEYQMPDDMPVTTLDDEHASALFDSLLGQVEVEQQEQQARISQLPQEIAAVFEQPQVASDTSQPFTDAERAVLRDIVLRFERPIPFNQIHNALREARKTNDLNRTNEELRTLIKQAINTGLLERSGKGNNIVYRLAAQPTDELSEQTNDELEVEAIVDVPTAEAAEPVAEEPSTEAAEPVAEVAEPVAAEVAEVAEPVAEEPSTEAAEPVAEDTEAAEPVAAEPVAEVTEAAVPVAAEPVAEVTEAAVPVAEAPAVEEVPAKPKRTRRKKAEEPVAEAVATEAVPAEEAPAKPKRTRRKKAEEPVAEAVATEAAPAEEAPAKPKRTRRKKAETEAAE
jgi:uncharacterized protein (TIGR00288 family)